MGKTDVLYFEGLEDILIAMMSPEAQDGVNKAPEYGGIVRLPIATKLAVKGNGTTLEKWASSKMFRRVSRETKHELGLDHVGIPIAESGVTFSKNIAREFPFFAFGFIGKIEGGGRKAVWYPKTQLSNVIDEEYATEEDETKIDDVTANLVATGLNYNNVMYSSFDSNRTTGSLALFEKFIAQPIYSEQQWQTIAAATPPVGGGE